MASVSNPKAGKGKQSFRVGRVRAFLRGRVWYLCYRENNKRHQPRVGPDRQLANQMAAEINSQLEAGAPSALGFEPITISDLRDRWLEHHEHVRRSSIQTIRRYRSATQHLIDFVAQVRPLRRASDFRSVHGEEFVRYLRSKRVAPNGHAHARKRTLRDCGIKFILETCSTLFNYAQRHRHLPPYAENPFRAIEIGRIPIEDAKPVIAFAADQERRFLEACDDWQFPIFLTFFMTGLRPGELTHLLLPDNLDLEHGWLFVRNKPKLGWQVKTRNERDIPLLPELVDILQVVLGDRRDGPVFRQRRCEDDHLPPLRGHTCRALESEMSKRISRSSLGEDTSDRSVRHAAAKTLWRDLGALKEDWIRKEFMRLTEAIGSAEVTAPKTLRHSFATSLQDANVDPLIRNELMGHAPGCVSGLGRGLGMTAIYTHTRPETRRRQLEDALRARHAAAIARAWLVRWRSQPRTPNASPSAQADHREDASARVDRPIGEVLSPGRAVTAEVSAEPDEMSASTEDNKLLGSPIDT